MLNLSQQFLLSSPSLMVFFTAIVTMLFDLFKPKSSATNYLAILGLLISVFLCCNINLEDKLMIWSNHFIIDNATYLMQMFIVVSVILSLIYANHRYPSLHSATGDVISLYLFATLGMMCLAAAQSLLTIYVCLELTSLPLYALVAAQKNDSKAVEAAVKYFIMGAIASAFILFGISILFGLTGNLDITSVVKALRSMQNFSLIILVAIIFIIAGVAFKLALFPFHMWIPDVYAGASPVVTLFLSAAPKIAGFAILFRLSLAGLFNVVPQVQHLIILVGLASITVGNLSALYQKDLRRLLAYSTIAHMGYVILGFATDTKAGTSGALFYILTYALMTLSGFAVIILAKNQEVVLSNVADLQGLNKRNPWLAAMLMIVFFSMAGVPPAIGFFAKFFIIRALVDSHLTATAISALLLAVIGAFYYLRLIKTMYFAAPAENQGTILLNKSSSVIYFIQAVALLLLGMYPAFLINACWQAF